MRIEWLNDEMTEACITRGSLWWKRQALVRQDRSNGPFVWRFVPSGEEIGHDLHMALIMDIAGLNVRAEKQRQERNWQPVTPMPQARQVRRG